jgi:hypothetical protein
MSDVMVVIVVLALTMIGPLLLERLERWIGETR